jgi:hypothetical protein
MEAGNISYRQTIMGEREPIEVCITVDTEFSVGGNFGNPQMAPVAEPIVLGTIGGQEHGLGFILDSLAEFGVRATFFVETLQTAYFGDEPMREIARRIADAGHDVQLHLHPCWLHYEAPAKPGSNGHPDDSCAGRNDAELDRFFNFGLSVFARWSLPPPIAVRAGNFQVDANFYRAAARWGLALSSSLVLWPNSPVGVWRRIGQVLEFPVFSYAYHIGLNERLRPLAITACSHGEILSVLYQAYHQNISPVVIHTHPQEYLKRRDVTYATLRRNRVNQTRLKAILRFLSENRDKFVTLPISAIRQDGRDATDVERPLVRVPARTAIARMIENGINDRIWWY